MTDLKAASLGGVVLTVLLCCGSVVAAGGGLTIRSPAFASGGEIPARYTCDGADSVPPLRFGGVPAGARSLVLIVDDPDAPDPKAPTTIWVHWIVYNLPPDTRGIADSATTGKLPPGAIQGINGWHRADYGGPCPPVGRHRYRFHLYALDTVLGPLDRADRSRVDAAMRGHVLARALLIGTYQKAAH